MYDFAQYRQSPRTIALHIVAVRFEGGDELHHIVEHLIYDEFSGKIERRPREFVVDYIEKNGVGSVVARDSYGRRVDVITERVKGTLWLRTRPDDEFADNLYALYRFKSPDRADATCHVEAMSYTGERVPNHLTDFIVYADGSGTAEILARQAFAERVAAAPGIYLIETPRIPRAEVIADLGPNAVVRTVRDQSGEDYLFRLTRRQPSILEIM